MKTRGQHNCGSQDLVFSHFSYSAWGPLLKHTVVKVLDAQITAMGLAPGKYRCHSFRFGSLQEAIQVEPSLELVRLQSDHVSDAVHGYMTSMPGYKRFAVAQRVGNHLRELDRRPASGLSE